MDERGYNPQQFSDLRAKINLAYIGAARCIVDVLEEQLIKPISLVWYTQEGVEYFDGFKQQVQATGEALRLTYDVLRDAIYQAGVVWADNTHNEQPDMAPLELFDLSLDVSAIQPTREDGAAVIEIEQATAIANNLPNIQTEIVQRIAAEQTDLDASLALIGGGQADAVTALHNRVEAAVGRIFSFLTEGDNNIQANIVKA